MMTKCSKIRVQVSVLRTNGPLISVFSSDNNICMTYNVAFIAIR